MQVIGYHARGEAKNVFGQIETVGYLRYQKLGRRVAPVVFYVVEVLRGNSLAIRLLYFGRESFLAQAFRPPCFRN